MNKLKQISTDLMKKPEYINFAKLFVNTRLLYVSSEFQKLGDINETICGLKKCRSSLKKATGNLVNEIFIFHINTMLEIIREGDRQKIYDYADAVHCIPEYMDGQRLNSFDEAIRFCNEMVYGFCCHYGYKYYYKKSLRTKIKQLIIEHVGVKTGV